MTHYEWVSLIVSVLGLFIAACAAISSSKANAKSEEANKSAEASVGISLRNAITSANEKMMDCHESMEDLLAKKNLTADEKRLMGLKQNRFNVALENYLNAYEEACSMYLDNKVDKVRFQKNYVSEIRNLVEKKELSKYLYSQNIRKNFI